MTLRTLLSFALCAGAASVSSAREITAGTALPQTCAEGAAFFNTSVPRGQAFFACTAAGEWHTRWRRDALANIEAAIPTKWCRPGAHYVDRHDPHPGGGYYSAAGQQLRDRPADFSGTQ